MHRIWAFVVVAVASLTAATRAGANGIPLPTLPGVPGAHSTSAPAPGTPAYFQRDTQNVLNAYGRQSAPDGQLNPNYIAALPDNSPAYLQEVAEQAANPT